MTEYVMPAPPKGMHWRVENNHIIGTYNTMLVSLCWDKRPFFEPRKWESKSLDWSPDPEKNAVHAMYLADKILDLWNANQFSVNGLRGARLGYGVTRGG